MPLIRVVYDNQKVDSSVVEEFSNSLQRIVSAETNIQDVFVYAHAPDICVAAAPISVRGDVIA